MIRRRRFDTPPAAFRLLIITLRRCRRLPYVSSLILPLTLCRLLVDFACHSPLFRCRHDATLRVIIIVFFSLRHDITCYVTIVMRPFPHTTGHNTRHNAHNE